MSDLVSLIIPIYNVEPYLTRLEESIFHQTYSNLEIILIDDGSTDSSGEVCDNWKAKYQDFQLVVIHQKNGGLSNARNTGIVNASGSWLVFMDSDDGVACDYVESLYQIVTNSDCLIGTIDILPIRNNEPFARLNAQYFGQDLKAKVESTDLFLEKLLYHEHNDVAAYGKIVSASLFSDVRFPDGKIFEDTSTTYKLFLKCDQIAVSHVPKYFYYIRQGSITNSLFSMSQMEYIDATQSMTEMITAKFPKLKAACDARVIFSKVSVLSKTMNYNDHDRELVREIRKELGSDIKAQSHVVLANPRSPQRDKFGVALVKYIGVNGFVCIWKLYSRLRGKI